LIHQILLLLLLLLNQRINQRIQKCIKSRIYSWTAFFNACITHFHIWCSFKRLWLFLSSWSRKMLRECNTLRYWYIKCLWKFLYPCISLCLWFWIITIKYNYNTLCLFLYPRPNSIIFNISYIYKYIPETSQN